MMLFSREIKNIRVQRWAMIFFVFLPVSCPTFDLHLSVCAEDFDPSFPPFFQFHPACSCNLPSFFPNPML